MRSETCKPEQAHVLNNYQGHLMLSKSIMPEYKQGSNRLPCGSSGAFFLRLYADARLVKNVTLSSFEHLVSKASRTGLNVVTHVP
jgi:hypothetical protein